eukprot:13331643-Heterocapsa_arctica.AAC.1
MQVKRMASMEAATSRSCLRTWKQWLTWCKSTGEFPLGPSSSAPVSFMHAQLHESPGGSSQRVAMSVPGT